MELHPGEIHQAENVAGIVAWVWPTPTPGYWHVSTSSRQATEEAVPTDEVELVLALWGFSNDGEWAHWPGPLHAKSPQERWSERDSIR